MTFVLVEGLATLVGTSSDGIQRIPYIYRPGEIVRRPDPLQMFEFMYEVIALTTVRAISLPGPQLRSLGRRRPVVLEAVQAELARQLDAVTNRFVEMTTVDLPRRVGRFLLDFAEENTDPHEYSPLIHPFTHEIISQVMGTSRPHTSTVLKSLEHAGAVKRDRQLLVCRARLHEIVEGQPIETFAEAL